MGILLTTLTLLTAAGALAALRALRPRFRFSWLLAVGGSIVAATSVLILSAQLPSRLDVPLWHSRLSSATFATFTIAGGTWPFILGVAVLTASILLAAPGRPRFPAPATWAVCMMIAGLGVLALSADSPLTLILVWAALDLTEAGLLLAKLERRVGNLHVAYAFAMRLLSIGLVMLAFVLGEASAASAKFAEIQSPIALGLLPIAALLRLSAFAFPWPRDSGEGPDDLGSMLQLTAGAASVGFLSQVPASSGWLPSMLLSATVALYAGWMFLRAGDLHAARPLWIMCVGALSVAAAVLANPTGSAAWGCATLFAGCPLFVRATRGKLAQGLLLLVLWILSGLPFSLTASAWMPTAGNWTWMLPVFLIAQAMLLAGSFHQAMKPEADSAMRVEVLALRGLQYASAALPILMGLILGLVGWPGAIQIGSPLAALVVVPASAGLVWAKRQLPVLNPVSADWVPGWLRAAGEPMRREGARLAEGAQRLLTAFTRTIEGEAGIMWGLLFLVLFVSLIAGGRP